MKERIAAVISRYNLVASQVSKKPRRFGLRYSDKKTREAITKFIEWCDEQGVDPVEFATARIYHQADELGRGIPRMTALRSKVLLKDDFYIDLHGRWWTYYVEPEKMRKKLEAQALKEREVAARLRHVQERFKSFHQIPGRERMCLASRQHSGGYHPHSRWCQQCCVRQDCIKVTDPLLVQLRSSCTEVGP